MKNEVRLSISFSIKNVSRTEGDMVIDDLINDLISRLQGLETKVDVEVTDDRPNKVSVKSDEVLASKPDGSVKSVDVFNNRFDDDIDF